MITRVNEGVGKFEMVARLTALSEMWGEDLRTTEGAFARQVLYESEQKEGKEEDEDERKRREEKKRGNEARTKKRGKRFPIAPVQTTAFPLQNWSTAERREET